jgi:hypothetical protein
MDGWLVVRFGRSVRHRKQQPAAGVEGGPPGNPEGSERQHRAHGRGEPVKEACQIEPGQMENEHQQDGSEVGGHGESEVSNSDHSGQISEAGAHTRHPASGDGRRANLLLCLPAIQGNPDPTRWRHTFVRYASGVGSATRRGWPTRPRGCRQGDCR